MNASNFEPKLFEVIGMVILHSVWQVTLLAVLLCLVIRLFRDYSSHARYILSTTTLLLSLIWFVATFHYEWNKIRSEPGMVSVMNVTDITFLMESLPEATATNVWHMFDQLKEYAYVLAWLWLVGIVFLSLRFAGSFYYLKKLQSTGIYPLRDNWKEHLQSVAASIGLTKAIRIVESSLISTPLTLGHFAPIVLLPVGMIGGLSTKQVEVILMHEFYHIKRGDYLVNIVQSLIEIIMFYHPAIWWISSIIREERENCCDDKVVAYCGDRVLYARALTQLQEINTLPKPVLAISLSGSGGRFTNRIQRLFDVHNRQPGTKFFITLTITALCFSAFTIFSGETLQENDNEVIANNFPGELFRDEKFLDIRDNNMPADTFPKTHVRQVINQNSIESYDSIVQVRRVQVLNKNPDEPKPLYFINGSEVSREILSSLHPTKIKSVSVLKDDAVGIYGERARSGVILIQTQTDSVYTASRPLIIESYGNHLIKSPHPLIIIEDVRFPGVDGQEILSKINSNDIASINVIKDPKQLEVYGESAVNGVIIITMKSGVSKEMLLNKTSPESNQEDLIGNEISSQTRSEGNVKFFPNPSTAQATITFSVPGNGDRVVINIFNSQGEVVKKLVDNNYGEGEHEIIWDTSGQQKDTYIIGVQVNDSLTQFRLKVE